MYAEDIIDEMTKISGTQLNSEMTAVFLEIIREGKLDSVLAWKSKSHTPQTVAEAMKANENPENSEITKDTESDDNTESNENHKEHI